LMKPTAVFMRPSTGFQSVGVAEILEGFQQVLSSHRSHMVMIDRAQDAVGHHRPAPFGGVLVIPSGVTAEDYKLLSDGGVRYMTAWETELPVEARKFHLGLEEGSFQSARRLFSAGHKKVGILGKEAPELQERKLAGVKRAAAEAGLDASALVEGTAAELLGTEGLTAIIALNDRLAEGAMLTAAKLGISIPKKVSLVSLQRWAMSNGASTVSSVDYHLVEAGRAAGERLLAESPEAGVVAEGRGFSLVAGETIAPAS
jgi:DNA-binding LacI/PurR family transcriptional regulator